MENVNALAKLRTAGNCLPKMVVFSQSAWCLGHTSDLSILRATRCKARRRDGPWKRNMACGLHVRHSVVPMPLLTPHDDFGLYQATMVVPKHTDTWTVHLRQHPVARTKRHERSVMERNAHIVQIRERHLGLPRSGPRPLRSRDWRQTPTPRPRTGARHQ